MIFHFFFSPAESRLKQRRRRKWSAWLAGVVICCMPGVLPAQTIIKGTVKDETTHKPLAFVSISEAGTNTGEVTDSSGNYEIHTENSSGTLQFSCTGYEIKTIPFLRSGIYNVALKSNKQVLQEVVVNTKKKKYRNKDNPAVDLIRSVIAHKQENGLGDYPFASYEEYEKMVLAVENPGPEILDNPLIRKYKFVFKNTDTTTVPGKSLLPLYIEENISDKYYRKHPESRKTIIRANKKTMLDKRFVNNESLGIVLKYIYQDIDIYHNSIYILTSSFLSPIADLSPTFYRFYITDTLQEGGEQLVRLSFAPRNSHDLLFHGSLYIALNGHYSVRKAELSVEKNTNINWINTLHVSLDYAPAGNGKYFLEKSKLAVDFGLGLTRRGLYGERTAIHSRFNIAAPPADSLFRDPAIEKPEQAEEQTNEFWVQNRPDSLTPAQAQVYKNMDSLNSLKSFHRLVDWTSFIIGGYKYLGPVEIGPLGTFYSFNEVEGLKLRFGGRTTTQFSSRYYLAGNIAYGFKDQRWKYYASAAYAFNNKSIYGYPQHFFQVIYLRDTKIPGRDFQDENNIFFSVKRGENDRYFYNDVFRLHYVNELISHLRFELNYEQWKQQTGGGLYFIRKADGGQDSIHRITVSEAGLTVRWAPHEQFLVRKDGRMGIPGPYPIITASIDAGLKGFLDGQYDYRKFQLSIQKRFYLSQLGFADITLNGGYLDGNVPYPLLFIPAANQTYVYQLSSYNLMNFMEFISDHYAGINIDYHMKGFLLNKIPVLRFFRLREVAGFKAVYGGLRNENNPASNNQLFLLPRNESGQPITFPLGKAPYMEFNVGIENILNIIRIDYVQRLSYLGHPGISPWGIRASVNVTF